MLCAGSGKPGDRPRPAEQRNELTDPLGRRAPAPSPSAPGPRCKSPPISGLIIIINPSPARSLACPSAPHSQNSPRCANRAVLQGQRPRRSGGLGPGDPGWRQGGLEGWQRVPGVDSGLIRQVGKLRAEDESLQCQGSGDPGHLCLQLDSGFSGLRSTWEVHRCPEIAATGVHEVVLAPMQPPSWWAGTLQSPLPPMAPSRVTPALILSRGFLPDFELYGSGIVECIRCVSGFLGQFAVPDPSSLLRSIPRQAPAATVPAGLGLCRLISHMTLVP